MEILKFTISIYGNLPSGDTETYHLEIRKLTIWRYGNLPSVYTETYHLEIRKLTIWRYGNLPSGDTETYHLEIRKLTIWRYGMLTLNVSFMLAYQTRRTFVMKKVPRLPCKRITIIHIFHRESLLAFGTQLLPVHKTWMIRIIKNYHKNTN